MYNKSLIILVIAVLFTTINSYAQSTDQVFQIDGDIKESFIHEYNTNIWYAGKTNSKLIINSDTLLFDEQENYNTNDYIFFVLLDSSYKILNYKIIESEKQIRLSQFLCKKNGNLVISGIFFNNFKLNDFNLVNTGGTDFFIIEFTNDFKPINFYVNGKKEDDKITSITATRDNGITITGEYRQAHKSTAFITKLDSNLNSIWTSIFESPIIHDLCEGNSENIYFSGAFKKVMSHKNKTFKTKSNEITFVAKLNHEGNLQWVKNIGGYSNSADFFTQVELDKFGNIYLSGTYSGEEIIEDIEIPPSFNSIFISKLDSQSNLIWFNRINQDTPFLRNTNLNLFHFLKFYDNTIWLACNLSSDNILGPNAVKGKGGNEIVLLSFNPETAHLETMNTWGSSKNDYCTGLTLHNDFIHLSGSFLSDVKMNNTQAKGNLIWHLKKHELSKAIDYKINPPIVEDYSLYFNEINHCKNRVFIFNKPNITNKFLYISTKGYWPTGYIMATLAKKNYNEKLIPEISIADYSWNEQNSYKVSFDIPNNGDHKYSYDNYINLSYRITGMVDSSFFHNALYANGKHYYLPVSDSEYDTLLKLFKESVSSEENRLKIPANAPYKDRLKYLEQTNELFSKIFSSIGLQYELQEIRTRPINPQIVANLMGIFDYENKFIKKNHHESVDEVYSTKITQIASANGELVDSIPNAYGSFNFIDKEVILPNGETENWKKYTGEFNNGIFDGTGELVFSPFDSWKEYRYVGDFRSGIKEGKGELYDNKSDSLLAKGEFINGEFYNGKFYDYYPNNHVKYKEGSLKNGKYDGNIITYNGYGYTLTVEEFQDGYRNGLSYFFYGHNKPNIKRIEQYSFGSKIGEDKHFFYDGHYYDKDLKIIFDFRTGRKKRIINDSTTLHYDFAPYSESGAGQLMFMYKGNIDSIDTAAESQFKYSLRKHYHSDNCARFVYNNKALLKYSDGSYLTTNYGILENVLKTDSIYDNIGHLHIRQYHPNGYYGQYNLHDLKGGRLTGEIKYNGSIDGKAIYYTPSGKSHDASISNGTVTWTEMVKQTNWLNDMVGSIFKDMYEKTVVSLVDYSIDGLNKIVELIIDEMPMEEDDINGGVQIDTEGNVDLLDKNGNVVPKQNVIDDPYPVPPLDDWELEPFADGTSRFILASNFEFGDPWPGLNYGDKIYPPNGTGEIRGNDDFGVGKFYAKRTKKDLVYRHKGIDYKIEAGKPVFSPVSGVVLRPINSVYGDNENYGLTGLWIKNGNHKCKILYVKIDEKLKKPGTIIKAGQKIGVAQSVSTRYASRHKEVTDKELGIKYNNFKTMEDHVHIELMDGAKRLIPPNGIYPDPVILNWLQK